MKQYIIFLILIAMNFGNPPCYANGQTCYSAGGDIFEPPTSDWLLRGNIGQTTIQMRIQFVDDIEKNQIQGEYFSSDNHQTIYLGGYVTATDTIHLTAYYDECFEREDETQIMGHFTGQIDHSRMTITGEWEESNGAKSFPVVFSKVAEYIMADRRSERDKVTTVGTWYFPKFTGRSRLENSLSSLIHNEFDMAYGYIVDYRESFLEDRTNNAQRWTFSVECEYDIHYYSPRFISYVRTVWENVDTAHSDISSYRYPRWIV